VYKKSDMALALGFAPQPLSGLVIALALTSKDL